MHTYIGEKSMQKIKMKPTSHREAVRFAKEKDETRLTKTGCIYHFHKDSHDISTAVCVTPVTRSPEQVHS